MKIKYFLSLFIFITTTLTLISVGQKSARSSESIFFFCQSNQGIPKTVAKNKNGQVKPIFNWNLDEEETSIQPKQLCNSVTQKLNNYHQAGNNLSSLVFKASTVIDEKNLTTLPAICISGTEDPCKLALFTLFPSENPQITATNALDSILDRALRANLVQSPTRGLQSTAYKVDFWQLFSL